MIIKPQILAAISGALTAYLAEEEAAQQTAALSLLAPAAPGGAGVSLYALAGRQQSMQLRLLAQRRSLR